jgi:hypothetical protein
VRVERHWWNGQAGLLGHLLHAEGTAIDGLRSTAVPFVPGVSLHVAGDAVVLHARLEAERGGPVPAPLWADMWAGGQAAQINEALVQQPAAG